MMRCDRQALGRGAATLLLLLCSMLTGTAARAASVREAEMASCLSGEISTWGDGQDRAAIARQVQLVYRHAGAPPRFSEATVRLALQRAATAWSACGVPGAVVAEAGAPAEAVVVAWDDAATQGNFALADLGRRRLWLSRAMFDLLQQRNPGFPAGETLQMAISHEMGHFFGLMAHSHRCVDVMSYYHDGKGHTCTTRDGSSYRSVPEYRALLPTACDIARCRAVNRVSP